MTMQFSAYQIESMLDDFQKDNFPLDRFESETLSLSEEAINEARQHFTPSANRGSVSVSYTHLTLPTTPYV